MPKVDLAKCNGDVNIALRRLKRLGEKALIWVVFRNKAHYIKPTTEKRARNIASRKRQYKKIFKIKQIREQMKRSGRY